MKKISGLGRQGLDVLLTGQNIDDTEDTKGNPPGDLRYLSVDAIHPGKYQPRQSFDPESLQELANSITAHGVVQPIVVRQSNLINQYELIAGERRWRAAKLIGLTEIPAIIRELANQPAAAMSLIENIQRQQLGPLEEATALQRLLSEFGLTHQQIAESIGRTRTAVSNVLRLLGLCDPVKKQLSQGELDMGHARALLAIKNPDDQQTAANAIIDKQLSVRATEQWVKQFIENKENPTPNPVPSADDEEIKRLQNDLSEWIGANVRIKQKKSGKGQLLIDFHNKDELEELIQQFKGNI